MQNKAFRMITKSLYIKVYFWSYDQKYIEISYYSLYFSAASIANISNSQNWI